jgi:hypothetical protein
MVWIVIIDALTHLMSLDLCPSDRGFASQLRQILSCEETPWGLAGNQSRQLLLSRGVFATGHARGAGSLSVQSDIFE